MNKYYESILPGKIYHLFNRAVGNEKLFKTNENYQYFLKKYAEHLGKVCNTYCYCLLPNHFHLLIRTKETEIVAEQYRLHKKNLLSEFDNCYLSDFIMERFSNLLNAYTKAFNVKYQRKGGLFMDFTKRINIENDSSFSKIIHYIHANPVHHGICERIEDWAHSSYHSILSDSPTRLLRNEVIEWFGSKEQFIKFHQQSIDIKIAGYFD